MFHAVLGAEVSPRAPTRDRVPENPAEREGRRAPPPHPRGVWGGVQRPAAPPFLGLHPRADAEKVIRE